MQHWDHLSFYLKGKAKGRGERDRGGWGRRMGSLTKSARKNRHPKNVGTSGRLQARACLLAVSKRGSYCPFVGWGQPLAAVSRGVARLDVEADARTHDQEAHTKNRNLLAPPSRKRESPTPLMNEKLAIPCRHTTDMNAPVHTPLLIYTHIRHIQYI